MYKYAYVYKFNNIFDLETDIENESKQVIYLNKNKYMLKQSLEIMKSNNTIYMQEIGVSEIWIYPSREIFIVLLDKCSEIKKIKFIKKYQEMTVLKNEIISNILDKGISSNVTKMSLQLIEEYGEEKFELMGNRLMSAELIEEMEIFESDSNWEIKEISFQITGTKFSITLKYCNRIKFNQKVSIEDVEETIEKLLLIIQE